MTTRIQIFVAVILAAVLPTSGCHFFGADEPRKIERWGGSVSELRLQWSAEPGIELLSGPAVPVRAYIESSMLAMFMGTLDYAYPGYAEAVPPNDPAGPLGANSRRPPEGAPLKSVLVGNFRYHILAVQQSGQDVAATVCRYTYRSAAQRDNGVFTSNQSGIGDSRGIYVERVMLRAPARDTAQLPPQAGPAPAPSENVFAGWQIVASLAFPYKNLPEFNALWPTYDADDQACVDSAQEPPTRRAFLIDGEHPRSEFPTAPASPGWPE